MTSEFNIVIPARMASERLPGKPLIRIAGKTLLQHVYQRAQESSAKSVVIATDDTQIQEAAERFGAQVVMTSPRHSSGSDRIAECVSILGWPDETLLVNLQGDEPLMPPACLKQVAQLLERNPQAHMATLYWPMSTASEIENPNHVKIAMTDDGAALLFSRSLIPYPRAWPSLEAALLAGEKWQRHVGLYAYSVGALKHYASLAPTPLEQAEKLEQLRVLENGGRIVVEQSCELIPAGVDTPEDLERVRSIMK
jgi:3-deoxy-manno-octulosonate cytidylyltransferase (CMP-KDO synthetase)